MNKSNIISTCLILYMTITKQYYVVLISFSLICTLIKEVKKTRIWNCHTWNTILMVFIYNCTKNSYYTLWWFTEVPLRSHDIFFNAWFFLLDNSDFFMGFIYARACIDIRDAKNSVFYSNCIIKRYITLK